MIEAHSAIYEEADLVRQSALQAFGVSQAQAFLDGSKRTAYFCANIFLRVNGQRFCGDPLEFADALVGVAEQRADLEKATARFEASLRARVCPNP